MLGMGVMINQLSGDNGFEVFQKAIGQTIQSITLADDILHFVFENGLKMGLFDDGQSCCEHRYMTCDDDLPTFVGAKLIAAEMEAAETKTGEYGDEHEMQFLRIKTDRGIIVCETHNEHNGYYGGFWIKAIEE